MAPGSFGADAFAADGAPEVIPWKEPPVEVALLDADGVIVMVNDEWQAFASANGGDPERTGVGVSYVDICASAADDPVSRRVGSAVRTALGGDMPAPLRVQVPCHGPHARRWYDVLVSSRFDDHGRCCGATVTFSLARSAPAPNVTPVGSGAPSDPSAHDPGGTMPAYYPERSERLGDVFARLMMERAPLGILVVDDEGSVVLAGRAAETLLGYGPDGLYGAAVADLLPGIGPLDPAPAAPGAGGSTGSVRIVDAVRFDGSRMPVELRHGHVPLSRGTGTVLLFRVATVPGPGSPSDTDADAGAYGPSAHSEGLGEVLARLDLAVRHIFSGGLTVTGAAASHRGEPRLASALFGATRELDMAVHQIRSASLHLQGLERSSGRRGPDGRDEPADGPDGGRPS